MDHYEFLKRIYFFKNLDEDELRSIAEFCREETYAAGQVLFSEGAVADRFYIVINGKVEVWKNYYDEKPDLLGVHGPGHFFGEMALVDDLPRSATAVAKEKAHTLFLFREDFHKLVREHANIALSVMMSMSFLVRSSNETFVEDLRKRNKQLEEAYSELERAQAERLRNDRLSTLGKFSSMVLHDIRNPLSIIKAQLQLMLMHLDEPERMRKAIQALGTETSKLERLAGEFLDYSRGEIRLDYTVAEPSLLVRQALEGALPRLEREGVRAELDIRCSGPAMLDAERISRVLYNLIDNARKAVKDGDAKLIRVRCRDADEWIVCTVEDTGAGMDADTRARIFEPFFSASGAGGTGLGLLIVKNVVQAHGGFLEVESEPGKGSCFTVRIPRRT